VPGDPLPNFVSSLSKYFRVEHHYPLLADIRHDTPESEIRKKFGNILFQTAQGRYLITKNGVVVRDKLIDLIHEEGKLTERVKFVMYFLFMFRDKRYRDFLCNIVGRKDGKWDTDVFRKHHTSYFRHAGGHKAFTNLRQFLFQAGVLRETDLTVYMPDLSGWFPAAVEVSAQSISDTVARKGFLASPYSFLVRRRINALLNATPDELAGLEIDVPFEEAEDQLPPIEVEGDAGDVDTSDFRDWDRIPPAQRRGQDKYQITSDPAVLERANYQHYVLESIVAGLCKERKMVVQTNRHIDLIATLGATSVLFEMKSCTEAGTRSQVRRAVSQLLEYRYLYQTKLGKDVRLCAVIERRPRKSAEWLLGYLAHLGMGLIWKNDADERLNCTGFTKELLGGLIPKVKKNDFGVASRESVQAETE
jgi:hypothetical protein